MQDSQIIRTEYSDVMKKSYIDYAMSVIIARALPDVRDGLKPVQRRTLYDMHELGIRFDKPYRKCARIVGDTMGKYHPHGDSSIYEALVVMAQEFKKGMVLVDGHGNFGSIEGDGAAAMRYTEARLAKITQDAYLADLDKDIINFLPNFDETEKEPEVLPVRIPNLLVNGAEGIAVGMATSIPTHNLCEVIDAVKAYMKNDEISTKQLMKYVKGPDFPTGGIVVNKDDLPGIYESGTGKIKVRGKVEVEEMKGGKKRLVISEIPYTMIGAGIGKFLNDVCSLVETKKTSDIVDISNMSSKEGIRIVIELKKDANPQVTLNRLFSQTQMQTTFGVILLALVDNQMQPKILTLRQILDEYIAFQEEVLTRRTRYDLRKAQERAHLLEGLLIAQDNIDEVIRIIRSSYDNAKERLMERFGLDDVQAQAIMEMQLRRLQGLDREKLEAEYKELEERIAYFNSLLADEGKLRGVLKEELIQIRDKYGDDRKTEIGFMENDIDIEDLIEEEQSVFTMTANGYIKRTSASEYAAQGKGGVGRKGMTAREEDYVNTVFTASTHDYILFFTDKGRVFRKKGYQIPEAGRTAKGTNIVNVLQVEPGEKVAVMIHTRDISEGENPRYLTMFTRRGTVKRLNAAALKNLRNNGLRVIILEEGDELIEVRETDGAQNLLIATHNGMAACFPEDKIRTTGRNSMGVRGIKLREGDYVVAAARAKPGKAVLTITENGYGKRSPVEDYRITDRGAYGIKNYALSEKTGPVAGVKVVDGSEDLLLVTQSGTIIRMDVDEIRLMSRSTQGVIVMRFKEDGDRVIALSLAEKEPGEGTAASDEELAELLGLPETKAGEDAPAEE